MTIQELEINPNISNTGNNAEITLPTFSEVSTHVPLFEDTTLVSAHYYSPVSSKIHQSGPLPTNRPTRTEIVNEENRRILTPEQQQYERRLREILFGAGGVKGQISI